MIDEENRDFATAQSLLDVHESDTVIGQLRRQAAKVRLNYLVSAAGWRPVTTWPSWDRRADN